MKRRGFLKGLLASGLIAVGSQFPKPKITVVDGLDESRPFTEQDLTDIIYHITPTETPFLAQVAARRKQLKIDIENWALTETA